jgi:hypothetical protein
MRQLTWQCILRALLKVSNTNKRTCASMQRRCPMMSRRASALGVNAKQRKQRVEHTQAAVYESCAFVPFTAGFMITVLGEETSGAGSHSFGAEGLLRRTCPLSMYVCAAPTCAINATNQWTFSASCSFTPNPGSPITPDTGEHPPPGNSSSSQQTHVTDRPKRLGHSISAPDVHAMTNSDQQQIRPKAFACDVVACAVEHGSECYDFPPLMFSGIFQDGEDLGCAHPGPSG